MNTDYEILSFQTATQWRSWLDSHGLNTKGVWLQIYKKASGVQTVTYAEALDHALCYGWIDGQKKSYDELSFLQKFTPRRPKSLWSKRNIEYINRLADAGLMMPEGTNEVQRAKADGRWAAAYDGPKNMILPDDFVADLQMLPRAFAHFEKLNKTQRYTIAWQLQTAMTDVTRLRRKQRILDALEAGTFG